VDFVLYKNRFFYEPEKTYWRKCFQEKSPFLKIYGIMSSISPKQMAKNVWWFLVRKNENSYWVLPFKEASIYKLGECNFTEWIKNELLLKNYQRKVSQKKQRVSCCNFSSSILKLHHLLTPLSSLMKIYHWSKEEKGITNEESWLLAEQQKATK